MNDRYQWIATYTDNTTLAQTDSDGTKHAYSDIDRSRLKRFDINSPDKTVLSMPFEPGEQLIWRRRVEMKVGGLGMEICHLVGKQSTINGENRQIIFAVFESDGHIEVSDKWDEKNPWFFPVQLNPEEGAAA